jgi:anhydro-N-acetylmuramic acid kinase
MNPDLQHLYEIALKPRRLIIGLMSGTSLDGLDIALCSVTGFGLQTKTELLHFETIPYDDEVKNEIRTVFSKKNTDLEKITLLHPRIALHHASLINDCLKKWGISNADVDLVASHGQTIYHAPKRSHQQTKFGNATLQIGDGDHLAVATGIITISDFRQKHIAAGGEGAPLAVYGDYLLFSKPGEDRILLNIGGIANFTFLPGSMNTKDMLCTDTGPGNTLMDACIQKKIEGKYFDKDASVALKGKVNDDLLNALKQDTFFTGDLPKTTGPELFNLDYLQSAKERSSTINLPVEDTMATLNKFTADTIIAALSTKISGNKVYKIFVSGGGMHNPLLMQHIREALPACEIHTTVELHIDPNAKEAVLFAVLANECICGDRTLFGKDIKGLPDIAMGKISFPS